MSVSEGRKKSHVVAEKKRREAIRKGFDQLTSIIPGLDARHARSEAVVIAKCVETLEKLISENIQLKKLAERKEIVVGWD